MMDALSVGMRSDPTSRWAAILRAACDQFTAPGGGGQLPYTPALLWELFRSRNLEGENLPPTRATWMPHR